MLGVIAPNYTFADSATKEVKQEIDPRDKLRTLKNKEGKTYKLEWWREIAWCGGMILGVSAQNYSDPQKQKILQDNAQFIGYKAIERIALDRKIDVPSATPIVSEVYTKAKMSFDSMYWTVNITGGKAKYIEDTMKKCEGTLNEYAAEFPALFQEKQ